MKPLHGIKILDFSTLLPGPYASLMLADLGADVLRIEAPNRTDLVRMMPPLVDGVSAAHAYLNRNKRSLGLDLKKPQSIEIIHQLLAEYDVVIEQFRPGVMARLGLDYDTLKAINPKLIYCSITGYGQTGELKDRAGHDINYLALAGVADYSRRIDQSPVPQGVQIADVAGGSHHAVMGIMAAIIQRQNSGKGQAIDISMTDAAFALNAMFGAQAIAAGVAPKAESTLLNGGSFYDYYETSDGRYMSVGSLEPQFLMSLIKTLGLEAHQALAASQKATDQKEFKQHLAAAFKQQSFEHWVEVFGKLDACVEPVLTVDEAIAQPHVKDRELVIEAQAEDGSVQRQAACPIKFSDVEFEYRHSAGAVGKDNQAVLSELGLTADQIASLQQAGVTN